jgi:oligosaccharide repeat unit polymerase
MEKLLWLPWYVFLGIICYACHRLTDCFTKINIFTIFLVTLLINHGLFLPSVHTVNEDNFYYSLNFDPAVKIRWILSLCLMYIFFIIGLSVSKIRRTIDLDEKRERNLDTRNPFLLLRNKVVIRPTFGFIVIALSLFCLVALWQPALIVDTLVSGLTSDEYKAARVAYGEQFSSQDSIFSRIASTIKLGLLPMFTYVYFLLRTQSYNMRLQFIFILVANILLGLMSGQKSGLSQTILGLTIAGALGSGNNSIRSKNITILIGIVLMLFFIIIPLQIKVQYPNTDYWGIMELLQYRMGGETTRTLQLYFYIYPDTFPHLLGFSSSILSGLFGVKEVLDPSRVVRSYIAFGTTDDATGSWNAAFIGTAWADFSFLGVVIQSMLVGMLLSYYHKWYLKDKSNPIVVGTYVSLAFSSINLAEGNLLTALLTGGLGLTFLFIKFFGDRIYTIESAKEEKAESF